MLGKPENYNRVEIRLLIRPFSVRLNCHIRGLASIRKGVRTENTPLIVSPYSIIASGTYPEGYMVEILKVPEKLFLPIRRGPNFANPEGSQFCQSGGVLFLPIRRGTVLPIRRGPNFANPEKYFFCQSGGVLSCQSGGFPFCQSGGFPFCQSEGYYFVETCVDMRK